MTRSGATPFGAHGVACLVGLWASGCAGSATAPKPAPGPEARPTYVRPPVPDALAKVPSPAAPRRVVGVLPNGLQVVVVEHHRRPVVMTRLVFESGVGEEAESEQGATNLAVSLLGDVHGDDEDGVSGRGEELLRTLLRFQGGRLQSGVTHDMSYIGIDGFAVDVEANLDRLGDIVKRPRRNAQMFDLRRTSIIHALEDIELSDDATLYRVLERAAFGPDHPYGRSVYGSQASLRVLGFEQVVWRQASLLDPKKTTLLVVGDVHAEAVLGRARVALGGWRRERAPREGRTAVRGAVAPPRRFVQVIDQPTAKLMTVCVTRPVADPSIPDATLDVLTAVLGGGLSGRLGVSLRRESGLAYSADALLVRRRHARAILACARVRAPDAEEALRRILEVFEGAGTRAPTAQELRRVTRGLVAQVRAEGDDLLALLALELERQALGGREDATTRRKALQAVSPEDVRALAARLLEPARLQIVLAGRTRPARMAVGRLGLGRLKAVSSVW